MKLLICLLVITTATVYCEDDDNTGVDHKEHTWSYIPGKGCPLHWPEMYPLCAGKTQSPINIDTTTAQYDGDLGDIEMSVITQSDQMTIQNNGHTVALHPSEEIHINGLDNVYKVYGPHFHWGNTSTHGSEHLLDNHALPLEMHTVTYNQEEYADLTAAVESGDSSALAVFGVFFKISPKNNSALDPIINNLHAVKNPDHTEVMIKGLQLKNLWPKHTSSYYRYMGSLTTPKCHEIVVWTLFEEKTPISEYQLKQFRSVLDVEGLPLVNNFRPVQELYGRPVYASFRKPSNPPYDVIDEQPNDYGAAVLTTSSSMLIISVTSILTKMLSL